MTRPAAAAAVLAVLAPAANAHHTTDCQTRECHTRVAERRAAADARWCARNAACRRRVALRLEMDRYRAQPMPVCTWLPESGPGPEFGAKRYLAKNPRSTASGKFQILDTTWRAFGGGRYAAAARWALPVHQERVARRVLAGQGLGAWVRCPR